MKHLFIRKIAYGLALAACFIAGICFFPFIARADDDSISLSVRTTNGISTHETSAVYTEGDNVFVELNYSGLSPNTTYTGTLIRIYFESPYFRITNRAITYTFTTDSTGAGTWTEDITDSYQWLGVVTSNRGYDVEHFFFTAQVTNTSDSSETYQAGCTGSSSDITLNEFSVFAAAATGTTVVNGNIWAGNYQAATIDEGTAKAGVNVSSDLEYCGIPDNIDIRVTSQVVHLTQAGQEPVGSPVVTTLNTGNPTYRDDYASVRRFKTARIDLGTYSNLEVGEAYAVIHTVEAADGSTWIFSTDGSELNEQIAVVEDNSLPSVTEDVAIVEISNFDENDELLPGVTFQIVSKQNRSTVLAEWTSTGLVHQVYLPAGDYILIEKDVPDSYIIAKEKEFFVPSDNVFLSGANFTCARRVGEDGRPMHVVDIVDANSDRVATTGYCFNMDRSWPKAEDAWYSRPLVFKEEEGTDENLENYLDFNVVPTEEMGAHLARIIYNGYPNNASGIQEKYGLTDKEFAEVTQYALWYYTDDQVMTRWQFWDLYDPYIELRDGGLEPENFDIYLYTPSNPQYQNIVFASFTVYNAVTVEIKNGRTTDILINKVDEKGAFVSGVLLQITDSSGTVLHEFETSGESNSFQLPVGAYVLTELSAPEGYKVADPISFEVTKDSLLVEGEAVEYIVMVDTRITVTAEDDTNTEDGTNTSDDVDSDNSKKSTIDKSRKTSSTKRSAVPATGDVSTFSSLTMAVGSLLALLGIYLRFLVNPNPDA